MNELDTGITISLDQWVTDVPQSMSGSETTIDRLFPQPAKARSAFEAAAARLAASGIALTDRQTDPLIEEVERAIADAAPLTRTINAWEGRWPLNTYRDRDASRLSRPALERLAMAEAMTLAEYGAAVAVRQRNRETHARLAARYDAAITLAAPGAAPVGLGSTGNPMFNVPASMLGIPAVSLPLFSIDGLPLGLHRSPVLPVRTPRCSRWRARSARCWA